MTQSALDAYAMANGYGKTTKAMSEAEKVALRYAFVQERLNGAAGDFARTSNSWANQTRILNLQFESLKATIGQGLINVLTPVLIVINQLLARLITLASAFKSFSELITGNKNNEIKSLGTDATKTASGLSDASDQAGNLADSTKSIGDAAKKSAKEMRSLMGFDKINKLSDPAKDASSSNSDSANNPNAVPEISAGNVDFGNLSQGETAVDNLDNKFKKLFENIQKLSAPAVDSLKRLWNEGLSKLGTFAWNALGDFFEHFLKPVGKWVMGEGLPRFIDALNEGLMNIDFSKINDALIDLWDALAPFCTDIIGEGLLWLWENVLVPLGTWVANEVVPRFLETLTDVIKIVTEVLEALQPLWQWFWDNVLQPIASWTGGIFLKIWDGINDALEKFADWCSKHHKTIETIALVVGSFFAAWKFGTFVAGIIKILAHLAEVVTFLGGFSGIIEAVGSIVATTFSGIVAAVNWPVVAFAALVAAGALVWKNWDTIKEKALQIWGSLKEWFSKTCKSISGFFDKMWKAIKEYFSGVGTYFKEKFTAGFKAVKNAFSDAKKFFKEVRKGIEDTFSTIPKWFETKFKQAWDAVRRVFSAGGAVFNGIKEGILSSLKSVINSLIRGINNVVSIPFNGLNRALDSLRGVDIMGMNPFYWLPNISTPQIPMLAQGGYVKANTPRLAMIGDNRREGEIVAPESKMKQMAMEAAMAVGGGITRDELERIINQAVLRIVSALASLGFAIDGETIARAKNIAQTTIDRRYNEVRLT